MRSWPIPIFDLSVRNEPSPQSEEKRLSGAEAPGSLFQSNQADAAAQMTLNTTFAAIGDTLPLCVLARTVS